jgi:hypothetical protein
MSEPTTDPTHDGLFVPPNPWMKGTSQFHRWQDGYDAAKAEARADALTSHPDDGHEHHFTCIRCGVDNPARADALHVEQVRRVYFDACRETRTTVSLLETMTRRLNAILAERRP